MTTSTEREVSVPAPNQARVGQILRWSARITSVPVFILVLTYLAPDVAAFSVSAKDDKIITLGLCGVCVGLVLGWRWARLGGGLVIAAVVLMLLQGDNLLYPDPFSVAFGLQGILFLISGVFICQSGEVTFAAMRWVRPAAIILLALCAVAGAVAIFRGPGPIPVPKDKETFIGVWQNGTGFTIEITAEGRAKVVREKDPKLDPWNDPLAQGTTGTSVFLAYFRADEKLELTAGPFGDSKVYHIDKHPHVEGKQVKMVLNGSDPYKRNSGMTLVKKPAS
jgi:hypothetical protein